MLISTELNDANSIRGIHAKVILVAAYTINVCKFTAGELKELDQVITREMRAHDILGKLVNDERSYLQGKMAVAE